MEQFLLDSLGLPLQERGALYGFTGISGTSKSRPFLRTSSVTRSENRSLGT